MMKVALFAALLAVVSAQNATNATVGANETGTFGEQTPTKNQQPVRLSGFSRTTNFSERIACGPASHPAKGPGQDTHHSLRRLQRLGRTGGDDKMEWAPVAKLAASALVGLLC